MAINNVTDPPSDPLALIKQTDWASLEHALGPADDTPAALADLLLGTPEAQAKAVRHLNDPVHHQDTLYSATGPAALYVAAILSDPRTDTLVPSREDGQWYPLRQELLEWLGSITDGVSNDVEAVLVRLGLLPGKDPEFTEVRALRPTLFRAVAAFFQDPNLPVREAALAAAVPLLDAPELAHHQASIAPIVRSVLATSLDRGYQAIAVGGLRAWGEETASLVKQEDLECILSTAGGCSDDPPF
ncbi:hypothetical protein ACFYUV_20285 [Nonomuraea sp. NPDC003560]|uniref:hypothetical protein n=1 Tax=Nonomuraea sp. NPDC003560 TaxID=3364341 RepID=UPI00368666D6